MSDKKKSDNIVEYARQVTRLAMISASVYDGRLFEHAELSSDAVRHEAMVRYHYEAFVAATKTCDLLRRASVPDTDAISQMIRIEIDALAKLADAAAACEVAYRKWGEAMIKSLSDTPPELNKDDECE